MASGPDYRPSVATQFNPKGMMSTPFKKLLLVSITLLLGVVSGGARSDTYYNFSASSFDGVRIVAVFGVDGVGVIQSISGTVSGAISDNGSINGLLPAPIGYLNNDNLYPITNRGVFFYTGSYPTPPVGSLHTRNTFGLVSQNLVGGNDYYLTQANRDLYYLTVDAIAPEMNASLIPQAGLLLGCLFFLFGRKKEVVEPLLTA